MHGSASTGVRRPQPTLLAGLGAVRPGFVRGRLTLVAREGNTGEPVRSGKTISSRDRLVVGAGGVQIALGSGVRIAAAEGARLRLGRLASGRPWVSLAGGALLASAIPGGASGGVAIEVAGGRFEMATGQLAAERRPEQPTRLELRSGRGTLTPQGPETRVFLSAGERGSLHANGTWTLGEGRLPGIPRLRPGRMLAHLDFERGAGFFPGYSVGKRTGGPGQSLRAKALSGDASFGLRIRSRWRVPTRPGILVRFHYRIDQNAPIIVRGTGRGGRFYTVLRNPVLGAWAICEVFPSTFRQIMDPGRRPVPGDRFRFFEILGGKPSEPGTLEIDDFEVVDLDR